MELQIYINDMQKLYQVLIEFIDSTNDKNEEFNSFKGLFEKLDIISKKAQTRDLLNLTSKLAENHHQAPDIFNKIECLLDFLFFDRKISISRSEIFQIFKTSKKTINLLFKKEILDPQEVYNTIKLNEKQYDDYLLLFYKIFKPFIKNENERQKIEAKIMEEFDEIEKFENFCETFENSSYICSLIRQDSVEEFIAYINKNKISTSSKINPSICETNPFLIYKRPTLIEYAAFFGSIEIFQYLLFNKVELTPSLWIFAVHSNNAQLIHLLEENGVEIGCVIEETLEESVKCHHNDITNYILNTYDVNKNSEFKRKLRSCIINCYNYYYMPNKISDIISKPKSTKRFNICDLYFSLPSFTIPSCVSSIGSGAFYGCFLLKEIKILSLVTSIESCTFFECQLLTSIILPPSITSIGDNAFCGCKSLKEINLPSAVITIGQGAFCQCSSLKEVIIPSSVTSIGENAFRLCTLLTKFVLSNSLKSIKSNTFYCCKSLSEITIPSSVKSILSSAFEDCKSLKQIDIPSSVTLIGSSAFKKCTSLINVSIPSSVTSIGFNVFMGCSSLEKISFQASVKSIGNSLFEKCSSLEQIIIPSSITSIGKNAFCGCLSLKQIIILSPEVFVELSAFEKCSLLKNIIIPASGRIDCNEMKLIEKIKRM